MNWLSWAQRGQSSSTRDLIRFQRDTAFGSVGPYGSAVQSGVQTELMAMCSFLAACLRLVPLMRRLGQRSRYPLPCLYKPLNDTGRSAVTCLSRTKIVKRPH